MRLVYEASNSVEGHMLVDMLCRAGLNARMDGEYLQGGVGDLQAMGLVRILVDDQQYDQARELISIWDEQQPETIPSYVNSAPGKSFLGYSVAFGVGVLATVIYFYTPTEYDEVDLNGDGIVDEYWVYRHDVLARLEVDRNFDGNLDFIQKYSRDGIANSAIADNDFDGNYETDIKYEYNEPVSILSSSARDSFKDYRFFYKHGVLDRIEYFDPGLSKSTPFKVDTYNSFRKVRSEFDMNTDGIVDTVREYDKYAEEI
jgi:hypothetical protein